MRELGQLGFTDEFFEVRVRQTDRHPKFNRFAADPKVEKALKAIGVLVFSHDALGSFTAGAARSYGDHTFVEMMWCAAASRGLPAALRYRRDSPPSDEAVGGLIFEFERISGEIALRDRSMAWRSRASAAGSS